MVDEKDIQNVINLFNELYGKDERIVSIAFDMHPSNKKEMDILIKIIVLDKYYSTHLRKGEIVTLAKHIVGIKELDQLLEKGTQDAVLKIGTTPKGERNAMSFASKYCSFHNPERFPIYDSISRKAIFDLNEKEHFTEPFSKACLQDYLTYCCKVDALISKYELDYSYKDLDKYLWMYGCNL